MPRAHDADLCCGKLREWVRQVQVEVVGRFPRHSDLFIGHELLASPSDDTIAHNITTTAGILGCKKES